MLPIVFTSRFQPAIVKLRVENHLCFVRQRKLLETLAGRDGLTEISNRRRFDEALLKEWRRARRTLQPLSLAMLDVDHFKLFNDNYGHAAGDHVLKSIAKALESEARRAADVVARYGGEEFVLLFPETDARGAGDLAERTRASVEKLSIPHRYSNVAPYVTVSIGGATTLVTDNDCDDLVQSADNMLYKTKHLGRNKIVWENKTHAGDSAGSDRNASEPS